jgi:hypothetical protein
MRSLGIRGLKITNMEILVFFIAVIICSLIVLALMLFNIIQVNTYGHNGDYILLFTGISAISTLVYAILSLKLVDETAKSASLSSQLVEETRKARDFQIQPLISIYLEGTRLSFIDTIIQNDGLGGAKNIKLTSDLDISYLPNKKISQLGYFNEGIQYLPPRSRIRIIPTYMLGDSSKINIKHNITVKYEDILGRPYERTIQLNYSEFNGYIPEKSSLVKSLETISDDLKQIKNEIANKQELEQQVVSSLEEVSEINDAWAKYLQTLRERN